MLFETKGNTPETAVKNYHCCNLTNLYQDVILGVWFFAHGFFSQKKKKFMKVVFVLEQ